MHSDKFRNILAFDAPGRYEYFVRKVCDCEAIWGLYKEGWATGMTEHQASAIPVWPEQEFAACCATGEWDGFAPKAIALHDFLDSWLPGATAEGRAFAIFPTPSNKAVAVESDKLLCDLRSEMASYT